MTSPGRPRPSTSSNITSPSLNRFPLRPSSFNDSRISSGTSSSSPLKARTLASPRPSSNLKPNGDLPLAGEKSSSRTLPAQKSFRAIPSKVPTYKLAPPPSAPASPSSTAPPVSSPTKGSRMGKETLRLRPAGMKDSGRVMDASGPVDGSAKGKERERPREEGKVVDRTGHGFVDGLMTDRTLPLAPEDSSPEPSPTEVSLEELESSAPVHDRSDIASSSFPPNIPLPPSPSTTPSSTPSTSQPPSPSPSRSSSSSDIDLEDRADQEDDSRSDAGDGTNDEEEVETEGMRTPCSHGSRLDVDDDASRVEPALDQYEGMSYRPMDSKKDSRPTKHLVNQPRYSSPLQWSTELALSPMASAFKAAADEMTADAYATDREDDPTSPAARPDSTADSPSKKINPSRHVDSQEKQQVLLNRTLTNNVMKDYENLTKVLSQEKESSNHLRFRILHHRCQTQIVGRRGKVDSDVVLRSEEYEALKRVNVQLRWKFLIFGIRGMVDSNLAASDPVPAPLVEEPEFEGLGRVGVFAPGEGIDDMMATTRRQKRMNYLPTGFNPSAPPSPSPRFKSDNPLDRFRLFPASKNAPKTIAALANLAGSIKSLCDETRRHPSSTTSLSDLLGLASKIPTNIFQCIRRTSPPVTEPKGNRADFWRTVNLHLWDGMVELRSLAVEQGRKKQFIEEEEGWTELVNVEDVRNKLPAVFAVLYELGVQVEKVEAKAESRK